MTTSAATDWLGTRSETQMASALDAMLQRTTAATKMKNLPALACHCIILPVGEKQPARRIVVWDSEYLVGARREA